MHNNQCDREAVLVRETAGDVTATSDRLTGYAVVYGVRSLLIHENGQSFYEVIDRDAFSDSIARRNVTFTFRHNDGAEYGDTASGSLKLTPDERGVAFELALPAYANHLRDKIGSRAIRGMSFGFVPTELEYVTPTLRHVRRGELLHVSPVYSPAYPQTSVKLVRPSSLAVMNMALKLAENG